jgi:hypothetical protein
MKEIRGEEKIATNIAAESAELNPCCPWTLRCGSKRPREPAIGRPEHKNAHPALLLRMRNVDADMQYYYPRVYSARFVAPRRTNPLAPPSGTTTTLGDTKITRGEPGLGSEKRPRKIDTSGGGTITRVTQAVSGGRHDGFKYFRSEARAPLCPVLCGELSRLLSLSLDPLFLSPSFLSVLAFLSSCLSRAVCRRRDRADVDVSAILRSECGEQRWERKEGRGRERGVILRMQGERERSSA